jgi:hypothetical protein
LAGRLVLPLGAGRIQTTGGGESASTSGPCLRLGGSLSAT